MDKDRSDVISHACGRSGLTVPFSFAVSVSPSPFWLLSGSLMYGFIVSALERPCCLNDMLVGPLAEPMARGYAKVRSSVAKQPASLNGESSLHRRWSNTDAERTKMVLTNLIMSRGTGVWMLSLNTLVALRVLCILLIRSTILANGLIVRLLRIASSP